MQPNQPINQPIATKLLNALNFKRVCLQHPSFSLFPSAAAAFYYCIINYNTYIVMATGKQLQHSPRLGLGSWQQTSVVSSAKRHNAERPASLLISLFSLAHTHSFSRTHAFSLSRLYSRRYIMEDEDWILLLMAQWLVGDQMKKIPPPAR
jgi:hypothetical protein